MRWLKGPPPGRGNWWIAWRDGQVLPVAVEPALINMNNPDAALMLKTLRGAAYQFDVNREKIAWHAPMEVPPPPQSNEEMP